MKKFTLLFCLALIHLSSFAQCDIPSSSTTNTGANMTVLLQPAFINSLPPMSGNDYLVARTQDGLTVGVIYWIDPDPESLAYLSLGTNVSLAIWGDDTGTPEVVDGAAANELISFQVVSGTTVYNGEFPTPINYTTNGMSFQTTSAETALCIVGCMDDTADNYDPDAIFYSGCITSCTDCACEGDIPEYVSLEPTGSNMSILLHSSFIESLPPFLTENSYIIATGSASGQIAGTALLGPEFRDGDQALLAIWSDDGLGSNVGLVGGDSIIFTYYDGPNVYNVDLMYSMDGTGDLISSITDPLIFINNGILTANGSHFNQTCEIADFSIPGCMDEDACNYYESATDDDGTCLVPDECNECVGEELSLIDTDANGVCDLLDIGCSEPDACNYNELATSNYDACIYSTDLDACASCSGDTDGTGTIVDNDADNDGICDADEQERCADISACNYNDDTTFDTNDDLCIYTEDACDTCSGETDGTGSIVDNDADDDTYCDADDVFPNDPAEWLDTDDDGLGDNADILSGCTEPTACNYDASTTVNTDNTVCNIPDGICESCSGETDGTGTIVDNDADDDTYCDADDVFPNDPAEWLDTDGDGLGDNADILSGCTDSTACNYNASTTVNTDIASCIYSTDLDACATCSGETDGSGIIVNGDADNDGLCDIYEVYGCVNPLATNYNANISPTDADDSCLFDQDYSDSLSYIIDSLNLDNSFSTAHIMMLQNQVTNLEQQLDLVWIINDENQDQYEETLANLQADLAEIQAFNVDNQIAYFQNLINTDNPGPYEVVVQAYMVIAEAYEECNPNVYGLIENYLNLGWNTIGYNVLYATPVEYQFASIINDVVLVKNNGGEIYWPYYNFNAIGDMIPGQGYQVRVSSVVDDFRFVE